MRRSLPFRFAVSLFICGLVGLGLAASAGTGPTRRTTLVTTSNGTVEGRFRGSSSDGIVLGMGARSRVIPWEAVSGVYFREGSRDEAPRPPAPSRAE